MRALSCVARLIALGLLSLSACARTDAYAVTVAHSTDSGASDGSMEPGSCPTTILRPGDDHLTLKVGSVNRSYVLHVPLAYDGSRPVPLVLDFHGVGGSGESELANSPYPAVTDPEGVIMAFPDGLAGPAGTAWNMGPCCVPGADDLGFVRALVAQISTVACIDATRIYAVGILTGSGMVYDLACRAADLFAAVAPASFDLLQETANDCKPTRPITEISFRGTAVSRVPYEGGASALVPDMPVTFLGAKATFEKWAQINGCTGSASAEDRNGCSSYAGCRGNAEVILCTIPGGHEDPGDANVAWPVLKRHSL